MKKIVVGIRIDEHLKDKLQKLADNAGVSLSAYSSEKLEDAISETERIDLLVRNKVYHYSYNKTALHAFLYRNQSFLNNCADRLRRPGFRN